MIDFKIGTPYSFRSYNCWSYVVDIRNNNGIKTKLFKPVSLTDAFAVFSEQTRKLEHGLLQVNNKKDFDIVIVKKGKTYHCGLCFGGDVIHCSRQLKQVVKESFIEFIKPYEDYTLWR